MNAARIQTSVAFAALLIVCPTLGADEPQVASFLSAARNGDLKAVTSMVDSGVDVNATNEYGATALSFACDKGHLDVVRYLLSKGADPNVKDSFYQATPMTWAIQNGHLEVAAELVAKGAEGTASLLSSVAEAGKTQLLQKLIATGKFDGTSLTRALMSTENEKTAEILKAAGAKPVTSVSRDLLDEYAGKYELQPGFIIEIRRNEDRLVAQLTGQPEFPIFAETENKFFWTVVEANITFERDDNKKVYQAVLRQMGRTMPARRLNGKQPEPVDPAEVGRYVGLYESNDGESYRVAIQNGQLVIGADGGNLSPLSKAAQHLYQVTRNPSIKIEFTLDGETVTGYVVDLGTEKRKRTKVTDPGTVKAPPKKSYARTDAKNWPSFRGSRADGNGDGQGAPTTWNAESGEGVKWKTAIPGLGHSSPVVWGDKVFVTTAVGASEAEFRAGPYGDVKSADDRTEHQWKVYCLDAKTGTIQWEQLAHRGLPKSPRHTKASQASCTPALTASHLIVNFGSEGLFAYNHGGKLLWKKDLGVLDSGWFYDPTYQWGFSSSPVIHNGLIIIQADLNSQAFIAAYDINNGEEVWRTERDELPSWGTPTVVDSPDGAQVVTNSTRQVYGYDVKTGKERWRLAGNSEVTVGTPVAGDGLIFFTGGYTPFQPVYAVKTTATGDITLKDGERSNEHVAWSTRRGGTYMPTPIYYEGFLYTCGNNGVLTCYDAATGIRAYRARIADGKAASYTASPVAADGKLYFSSEESGVFVVEAGPEYKLLAENPMGEIVMATPAISNGLIFVRTQNHVFGIGD